MSEALYERYKDALRRGHVAALRGRQAVALDAYGEAARIAPDRALPLASIGSVLARMGKPDEALAAYDAALERSAGDEGALRGRADLLISTGDRSAAARTYDRLAGALDTAGRLPDAADAARRALELAESRGRRATMRAFVTRLADAADDPVAADALARASSVFEGRSSGTPFHPPTEPAPPPFDPVRAIAELDEAVLGGDPEAARTLAMTAAAGHRAAGQPSTAIDACYIALAGTPGDPGLHLTLAELYLDQGWTAMAVDKLALLARLADLDGDTE
ncbi:MAG: tetratricopeptide repeat protein, partial [Candidatus Limnocylindrales bacterium]